MNDRTEYYRAYREKNRDRINANARKWAKEHPENVKAITDRYKRKHCAVAPVEVASAEAAPIEAASVEVAPVEAEKGAAAMDKRASFMTAMLTCATVSEAARKASIGQTTAFRYMRDPVFKSELDAKKAEIVREAARFLQSKLSRCAEELMKIVESNETPASVKVQAIGQVFSTSRQLTDQADIMGKMAEIEEALNKGGYKS